jgi:hypothetical protein
MLFYFLLCVQNRKKRLNASINENNVDLRQIYQSKDEFSGLGMFENREAYMVIYKSVTLAGLTARMQAMVNKTK